MEVLHDRLSALFAADPTLRPHDVIVMTPSIDTYAPLVEAVFTSPDRPYIPFTIADRRARATRDVVDAFLRTLDVLAGRLPASAVLDLLTLDAVRQRFAIPAEALDVIRGWTEAAGVRWGADAAHRAEERLPPCGDNTWRFGLDRLLLGTALPSVDAALWQGTLPSGDLEGGEAELLGQFVAFVETLMPLPPGAGDRAHAGRMARRPRCAVGGHDARRPRTRSARRRARRARAPGRPRGAGRLRGADRPGGGPPASSTTRSRSRPRRSASSRAR